MHTQVGSFIAEMHAMSDRAKKTERVKIIRRLTFGQSMPRRDGYFNGICDAMQTSACCGEQACCILLDMRDFYDIKPWFNDLSDVCSELILYIVTTFPDFVGLHFDGFDCIDKDVSMKLKW